MAWEDRQDMEKAVRDEQERVLAEAKEKAYRDPAREQIEELRRRYLEAEGKGTDD